MFHYKKLPHPLQDLYFVEENNFEFLQQIEDLWLIAEKFDELSHIGGVLDDVEGNCMECGKNMEKKHLASCKTVRALKAIKRLMYDKR